MDGHAWGQGVDSERAWLLKFSGGRTRPPRADGRGRAAKSLALSGEGTVYLSMCGRRACPGPVLTLWLHPFVSMDSLLFHSSLLVLWDQNLNR